MVPFLRISRSIHICDTERDGRCRSPPWAARPGAGLKDIRAAVVEEAALPEAEERRDDAGDGAEPLLPLPDPQDRDRAHQADRVGVLRVGEEGVHVRHLHDLPGIHDRDLLGHLGDHPEVVGDEKDGGAGLLLELVHQIEDLRLDRHVEGRGRLVGDHQLRGWQARAMAIITRWRIPPLIWWG